MVVALLRYGNNRIGVSGTTAGNWPSYLVLLIMLFREADFSFFSLRVLTMEVNKC